MDKKPRIGRDPLSWIKNTKEKKKKRTSKPARQQDSKTVKDILEEKTKKKATYYLEPSLIKSLKLIGIEKDRDLSNLVSEAIEDLIKKYSKTVKQHTSKTA